MAHSDQPPDDNTPPSDTLLLFIGSHLSAAGYIVNFSGLKSDPPESGLHPTLEFRGPGSGGTITTHPDRVELWVRSIVTWVTSDGASHEEVRPYHGELSYEDPDLLDEVLKLCTRRGPVDGEVKNPDAGDEVNKI